MGLPGFGRGSRVNLEITCVTQRRQSDPHLCISHVGGQFTTGKPWKATVAEAAANIESGRHQFYIKVNGAPVPVLVAEYQGNKYLKTQGDDVRPERLLTLPACPI